MTILIVEIVLGSGKVAGVRGMIGMKTGALDGSGLLKPLLCCIGGGVIEMRRFLASDSDFSCVSFESVLLPSSRDCPPLFLEKYERCWLFL